MSVSKRPVEYKHDGDLLEGLLVTKEKGARPTVIISHAWAGRGKVEEEYAERLASEGYSALALDLYGKGVLGTSTEENQALMTPFVENRDKLQSRLLHIIDTVKGLPEVDESKVVFMGFCFGGLCALDVARAGGDVKGVASFHGLFMPAPIKGKIKTKVIAFHGWDDPMVSPDDVKSFGKEMTDAGADWQVHAHGGAMHAFMTIGANDPDFGTVYSERTAKRCWKTFQNHLDECFA